MLAQTARAGPWAGRGGCLSGERASGVEGDCRGFPARVARLTVRGGALPRFEAGGYLTHPHTSAGPDLTGLGLTGSTLRIAAVPRGNLRCVLRPPLRPQRPASRRVDGAMSGSDLGPGPDPPTTARLAVGSATGDGPDPPG